MLWAFPLALLREQVSLCGPLKFGQFHSLFGRFRRTKQNRLFGVNHALTFIRRHVNDIVSVLSACTSN
tara:strand:- start:1034 stop:1237 length:204 start_codon:yes stop_codon:yes gene_type:complete